MKNDFHLHIPEKDSKIIKYIMKFNILHSFNPFPRERTELIQ